MLRKTEGEALLRRFEFARARVRAEIQAEAQQLRQSIATDIEALHAELEQARAELRAARAEVERLTALTIAAGGEPRRGVH